MAETGLPSGPVTETDVVVVGSGPAGASAALFLATLGIPNIMITKYRWTANTPRAHITNQRAMEIFRDLGIEAQVQADATPHELMGDTVFCTSIAGEEIGRIRTWGTHPAREGDYRLASPCLPVDIPQTYLEPILVRNAAMRGTQARFSTEYLGHRQDADGVDVHVRDRLTGRDHTIRAKYLVGADGARSKVAGDVDLPMEGAMDIAGSMNITFKADISARVGHRPSVLYWVIQPGSNVGGIGAGLVRMVRPWNEWLIVWGYDINQPAPVVDDSVERAPVAKQIVQRANKSSREFVQFFEALGLLEAKDQAEMDARIEERKVNTPAGAANRAALVLAMELKHYEFNAHGVELGQFYESDAVVSDGSRRPQPHRDPGTVLRAVHGPGIPAAARLRGPRASRDVHTGPGADDPVHPVDRDSGGAVGRGRREGGPGIGRAVGDRGDRSRLSGDRPVLRLGAATRDR